MPYAPPPPTTHLPGTSIALGLESGRNSAWWQFQRRLGLIATVGAVVLIVGLSIPPFGTRSGLFPTLVLGVIGAVLLWRISGRLGVSGPRFPRLPDRAARIGIVGPEPELAKLVQAPPIRDEAFEPVVLKLGAPALVFPIVLLVSVSAVAVLLLLDFRPGPRSGVLPFLGIVLANVPVWGFVFAFPRYARLVPGRMDILRGSFLGRRLRLSHSYDLHTPAVLVDLNDRCLLLIHPGGRTQVMHLPAEKERGELVPEILRAAICTAPAAPLPDDALVG